MKKRLISFLLAVSMMLSILPVGAFAADTGNIYDTTAADSTTDLVIGTNGYPQSTSGKGWTYTPNAIVGALTLNKDFNGSIGPNTVKCSVLNYGTVTGGTFEADFYNYGTITDGEFNRKTCNYGTVLGGTFNAWFMHIGGSIQAGKFNSAVDNRALVSGSTSISNVIEGGDFYGTVNNQRSGDLYSEIRGGTFHESCTVNNDGVINGGVFYGPVTRNSQTDAQGTVIKGLFLGDFDKTFVPSGTDYAHITYDGGEHKFRVSIGDTLFWNRTSAYVVGYDTFVVSLPDGKLTGYNNTYWSEGIDSGCEMGPDKADANGELVLHSDYPNETKEYGVFDTAKNGSIKLTAENCSIIHKGSTFTGTAYIVADSSNQKTVTVIYPGAQKVTGWTFTYGDKTDTYGVGHGTNGVYTGNYDILVYPDGSAKLTIKKDLTGEMTLTPTLGTNEFGVFDTEVSKSLKVTAEDCIINDTINDTAYVVADKYHPQDLTVKYNGTETRKITGWAITFGNQSLTLECGKSVSQTNYGSISVLEDGTVSAEIGADMAGVNASLEPKFESDPDPIPTTYSITCKAPDGMPAITAKVNGTAVTEAAENDTITLSLDTTNLPENTTFANWKVTAGDDTVEVTDSTNPNGATFTMPGKAVTVTYTVTTTPVNPGDDTTDTTISSGGDAGAGAAIVLGGAALTGAAYLAGTQIYLETTLGSVPTNRQQMALALWNKAGRPEPVSTELFTDISAAAADSQKAARWCVEQGLMKAEGTTFTPDKYVFRPQVIKAWNDMQAKLKAD